MRSKWWGTEEEWTGICGHVSGKGTQIDGLTVYNAEQVQGLVVEQYRASDRTVPVDYSPAEKIIRACRADIRFQRGNQALYHYPPLDYILFPLREQFENGVGGIVSYYDSLFHELAHWSEPRLGWRSLPVLNEFGLKLLGPFWHRKSASLSSWT